MNTKMRGPMVMQSPLAFLPKCYQSPPRFYVKYFFAWVIAIANVEKKINPQNIILACWLYQPVLPARLIEELTGIFGLSPVHYHLRINLYRDVVRGYDGDHPFFSKAQGKSDLRP